MSFPHTSQTKTLGHVLVQNTHRCAALRRVWAKRGRGAGRLVCLTAAAWRKRHNPRQRVTRTRPEPAPAAAAQLRTGQHGSLARTAPSRGYLVSQGTVQVAFRLPGTVYCSGVKNLKGKWSAKALLSQTCPELVVSVLAFLYCEI